LYSQRHCTFDVRFSIDLPGTEVYQENLYYFFVKWQCSTGSRTTSQFTSNEFINEEFLYQELYQVSSCFACSTNQNDNESEGEIEMRPLQGTTYIQLNVSSFLKQFSVNIDILQINKYYTFNRYSKNLSLL